MPVAANGLAIAATVIMLILCSATVAALFKYRFVPAVRGASPPFLALVAGGLALTVASLLAWSSPVSAASCAAFPWAANLGFTQ